MMSTGTALAQDATPAAPTTEAKAKNLDTITVTGSRVRRVDTETASPVLVLDKKAIEQTGKMTIGEIVNNLPNIAGAPLTTATNNGGGTGASTAELRGLGSVRTLVLIDGHRPGSSPVDLNAIPLVMVERIEVLTEGSSTVYGSDAIGGVINFIMKKNYNGAQFTSNYGESGHHDGERKGDSFTFGQSGDKGNVSAGVEYNKFDAVSAGNRKFSQTAIYLTYGIVLPAGSGRNPQGQITLPASVVSSLPGLAQGCSHDRYSLIPGKSGTSASDYQCYTSADAFNFQPYNVDLSPQERSNAFAMANYNLTDDISAYLDFYHQKQTAQSQIAPLAFDAAGDNVTISSQNMYNPFGVDIGGQSGNEFLSRFTTLGQRIFNNTTDNDTLFVGLKGNFGQTWSWDAGFDYNHSTFTTENEGYINNGLLTAALGPSMLINGVPTCVTTTGAGGTVIPNCTPLNLFNVNDPNTIRELTAAEVTPIDTSFQQQKEVEINASGDIFDLPAGAAKLAVGADEIKDYSNVRQDSLTIANPITGSCGLSQETCGTPFQGGFDDKEVYAELFVPILKDAPGAQQLNIDVGTRYSKYNIFKGNDSSKIALEWRPIKDLLIRGSASDVFRAPNTGEQFAGAAGGAFPVGPDPCDGLGPANNYNGHAAACGPATGTVNADVPPVVNGKGGIAPSGLSQVTGVSEGAALAGLALQPEKGRSYDFGFVYDPQFVPGLSTSIDFYRVDLNDNITALTPDIAEQDCFYNAASPFCGYIHRQANGTISLITLPTVNLGSLKTYGEDFSFKYKLPVMPIGQFAITGDFTHIQKFTIVEDPTTVALGLTDPLQQAGLYSREFGSDPKWRGNFGLDWSKGDWNIGYTLRWVGKEQIGRTDPKQGQSADGCNFQTGGTYGYCPRTPLIVKIPNYFESFFTAGYNFGAIGTMTSRIDVGVDNAFDKQPPFFSQTNVLNANTDVSTYDTVGRLFWARFTAKF